MPSDARHSQVAALPVKGKPGSYLVLLITSRETKRWIIPKGWPMKSRQDHEAAAREAYEEAGVSGRVHRHPMGTYTYGKADNDVVGLIRVNVYMLEVATEHETWPERRQRVREWVSTADAAQRVEEPGLAEIIGRLDVAPLDA